MPTGRLRKVIMKVAFLIRSIHLPSKICWLTRIEVILNFDNSNFRCLLAVGGSHYARHTSGQYEATKVDFPILWIKHHQQNLHESKDKQRYIWTLGKEMNKEFKKIVLHLWFSTPNSKLWWEMSSVRDNHVKVKGLLKLLKGGQKNHVFHMQ